MISPFLYQRGLHELGAGARRPARRRGESGPAPSGLEVLRSFCTRTEELSQVLSFRDIFLLGAEKAGQGLVSAPEGSPSAVSWCSCGDTESAPLPCSRPRCSCRFFACLRYCRWLPAFYCYPELCCPWLLEALRPSRRRPRAPATFQDQSLQPLSLVRMKKSPRRSPGGDLGPRTKWESWG